MIPRYCTVERGEGLARRRGACDIEVETERPDDPPNSPRSALNPLLLASRDVFSNCFGRALHRFRRHLQASQQFELAMASIERRLLADGGLQAAHARRELRVFDIQFDVSGKLARVAVWAQ